MRMLVAMERGEVLLRNLVDRVVEEVVTVVLKEVVLGLEPKVMQAEVDIGILMRGELVVEVVQLL